MPEYKQTDRTRLKRAHKRGSYDRETVQSILDEALVCHVAITTPDKGVMNIPTSHWRVGDTLYIHGASKGASIVALESGAEACIVVSLIDGAVFARSAFSHSVNFRSVMIYATGRVVVGEEKLQSLKAFINKYASDRWDRVRPPAQNELKATKIIAFDIVEASAKVRSAPPSDDDLDIDVWAGVVPLRVARDPVEPCLKAGTSHPVPDGLLPHLKPHI